MKVDYDTVLNFSLLRTPCGSHGWAMVGHPRPSSSLPLALCCDSRIPPGSRQSQGEAPTGCSHSCSARLLSAVAAHLFSSVLEYQPEPWLSWLGLQGVIFNPCFEGQEEKHMAYAHLGSQEGWGSVPAAAGVILVLLSFHRLVPKVCSSCLGVTPRAGELQSGVTSSPLQPTGAWTRVSQGRGTGGGIPSSPGFPSLGSAPQQGWEHLKGTSRSHWGFWGMAALGVWKFVGLRTDV